MRLSTPTKTSIWGSQCLEIIKNVSFAYISKNRYIHQCLWHSNQYFYFNLTTSCWPYSQLNRNAVHTSMSLVFKSMFDSEMNIARFAHKNVKTNETFTSLNNSETIWQHLVDHIRKQFEMESIHHYLYYSNQFLIQIWILSSLRSQKCKKWDFSSNF